MVKPDLRTAIRSHLIDGCERRFPVPPCDPDFVAFTVDSLAFRLDQLLSQINLDGEEAAVIGDFPAEVSGEIKHFRSLTIMIMVYVINSFSFMMPYRICIATHVYENDSNLVEKRDFDLELGQVSKMSTTGHHSGGVNNPFNGMLKEEHRYDVSTKVSVYDYLDGAVKVVFVGWNMRWKRQEAPSF